MRSDHVFPTRVGMVRWENTTGIIQVSFPHACGDGPTSGPSGFSTHAFSPRVWGWSGNFVISAFFAVVFPTRVGMVRHDSSSQTLPLGFPHACGDGPR